VVDERRPVRSAGAGPHRRPGCRERRHLPAAFHTPLTCLRRREEDRQWLASNLQMLVPALRHVTPKVTFGPPIGATTEEAMSTVVLSEARRLMEWRTRRPGW
jgi:hypothetical protein